MNENLDWNSAPEFGRRDTLLRTLHRLWEVRPGPPCIVETGTLRNDTQSGCAGDGWSTLAWGWYCAQTGGTAYTVDVDGAALDTCRRLTGDYAAFLHYIEADSVGFLREWTRAGQRPIDLLYLDSLDYIDREKSEAHHLEEAQAALPWLAPICLVLIDDTCRADREPADREPADREPADREPASRESADEQEEAGSRLQLQTEIHQAVSRQAHSRQSASQQAAARYEGKGALAVPFLMEHGFQLEWALGGRWGHGGQVLLSRGIEPGTSTIPTVENSESSSMLKEENKAREANVLASALAATAKATASNTATAKQTATRIGQVEIEYCNGDYNGAASNERTVEVPLGFDFISRFEPSSVVEVGAVLPYYGPASHGTSPPGTASDRVSDHRNIDHRVIDLFDTHPQALREDALSYSYLGCNVLSISTVEHLGRPDYGGLTEPQAGPSNDDLAFNCLTRMIAESLSYLITLPIGYHARLDRQVQSSPFPRLVLVRDAFNNWSVQDDADDFPFQYGSPFNNANALWLLTNVPNYFQPNP